MPDRDSQLIAEAYMSINNEASVDPTPLLPFAMAAVYLTHKGIEKIKKMMSPHKEVIASFLKNRENAQAVKNFLLQRNVDTKTIALRKIQQYGGLKGDRDKQAMEIMQILSKMSPEDIKDTQGTEE